MSDHELPERYVPSELRPDRPSGRDRVAYAIGFRQPDKKASYAMTHGPFPTLKDALETVPNRGFDQQEASCIIRFNKDGTDEELYRWKGGAWVRWQGKDTWDRAMRGGHG